MFKSNKNKNSTSFSQDGGGCKRTPPNVKKTSSMNPPKTPKKNKYKQTPGSGVENDQDDPIKIMKLFHGFLNCRHDAASDLLSVMQLMHPHQHDPLATMKHELMHPYQKHDDTVTRLKHDLDLLNSPPDAAADVLLAPPFPCPNYEVYPIHNFEVWTKNAAGAYKVAPMILDRGSHHNIIGVHWLWNKRLLGKQIWLQCKTDDTKFFGKKKSESCDKIHRRCYWKPTT